MAGITVHADLDLQSPTLVEGLPGVGLVGKIATDHLVEELDMTYYASVECEGLPRLGVYAEGERDVQPPVRLYADAANDLLALQSDVPVSPQAAPAFADCVTGWLDAENVTPVYISGLGTEERATPPELFGVATGGTGDRLDDLDLATPSERGAISGPTGALVAAATERSLPGFGLVVETNPQFPDPEAARVLIEDGVGPLAGVEVDTDALVEQAEDVQAQREQLAKKLQEAEGDASSEAKPLRMYQ
ncbi:proteasome assembly chaperone family protein [Salinarchaeum chitinilyticum]